MRKSDLQTSELFEMSSFTDVTNSICVKTRWLNYNTSSSVMEVDDLLLSIDTKIWQLLFCLFFCMHSTKKTSAIENRKSFVSNKCNAQTSTNYSIIRRLDGIVHWPGGRHNYYSVFFMKIQERMRRMQDISLKSSGDLTNWTSWQIDYVFEDNI